MVDSIFIWWIVYFIYVDNIHIWSSRLLMIDINNNPFLEIGKFCRIKQLLYSELFNLIILIPGSINDIICYEFPKNKISFKIEIKEEIVYTNISKIDKGKYILINISKLKPKILLYNL